MEGYGAAGEDSGRLDELDTHRLQGLVDGLVEVIRRVVDANVLDGTFEELFLSLIVVPVVTSRDHPLTDELAQTRSPSLFAATLALGDPAQRLAGLAARSIRRERGAGLPADENRTLLDRYIAEVWGAGDPEAVVRFAAETFKRHTSPGSAPLDRAAQIERLKGIRAAFPDITIEVEDVVTEGDMLVFRSTMRGTHEGEFLGLPPTGRQVVVGLLDLVRIEDGRFAEQWGGPDMLDLVRQIGGWPGA